MEIIKVENGNKKLLIVAKTDEDKDWLRSFGDQLTIQIITEQNVSILGTPLTGSLLLTQKNKTNEKDNK